MARAQVVLRGDRVALMMPNILQYPVALFGAIRAGFTVVNTNPLYTVSEMVHQFKNSQAKALVVIDNTAAGLKRSVLEAVHFVPLKSGVA